MICSPLFHSMVLFHSTTKQGMHSCHTRGFVTLYAMLIILALSSLAFTIGAIGLKQYQVVATGSNSQRAQYYAESGIECALYARLDRHINGNGSGITCAGESINSAIVGTPQYVFFPGGGCAVITFTATEITSLGYDRGQAPADCPSAGAQVERGYIERKLQSAIRA